MTDVVGKNMTVGRESRTFEIVIRNRRQEQKQQRYIVVNGIE